MVCLFPVYFRHPKRATLMDQPLTTPFQKLPYRIRIGLTGTGELPDRDHLETMVLSAKHSILQYLCTADAKRRFEEDSDRGTPFVFDVVSSLAERAEHLAASVLATGGVRLVAVLPLTEHDCLTALASDEASDYFRRLLAKCQSPVRLRTVDLELETDDPARRRELLDRAYNDAGRYIVDHCDVLFALSNQESAGAMGGTARIVDFALKANRPVVVFGSGQPELINPEARIDASTFEGLRRFNLSELEHVDWEAQKARFATTFFGNEAARCIPEQARGVFTKWLLPYYARASYLAGRSQTRFFRRGNVVYALSAISMACVFVGVLVDRLSNTSFAIASLSAIAGAVILYRGLAPDVNWREGRVLTERIRGVGLHTLYGLSAAPLRILPFDGRASGDHDWTVRACEEICERQPDFPSLPEMSSAKEYIRVARTNLRIDFRRNDGKRDQWASRRLERLGVLFLAGTVAATAAHLAWSALPEIIGSHHWIHKMLSAVSILFPGMAAALVGIQVTKEHLLVSGQAPGHQLSLLGPDQIPADSRSESLADGTPASRTRRASR